MFDYFRIVVFLIVVKERSYFFSFFRSTETLAVGDSVRFFLVATLFVGLPIWEHKKTPYHKIDFLKYFLYRLCFFSNTPYSVSPQNTPIVCWSILCLWLHIARTVSFFISQHKSCSRRTLYILFSTNDSLRSPLAETQLTHILHSKCSVTNNNYCVTIEGKTIIKPFFVKSSLLRLKEKYGFAWISINDICKYNYFLNKKNLIILNKIKSF